MITVPQPVVPGERLSAAKTNAIIDTLRRLRPIPGQGVALEETPSGVVVSVAQHAAHTPPASVSFRVTADRAAGKALRIAVDKGRLCTVGQQLCRELALTLQQDGSLTEQNGRWYATLTEDATLYIAPKEDTGDAYELRLGSIDGSTPVTARIADIRPSAESPVTQHILGDLYLGDAAESGPLPWLVREGPADDVTGMAEWQIYSPLWIEDGQSYTITDAPVQDSPGWYTLPISPSDGTALYAILTDGVLAADVSDYRAAKSVLIGKFVQITVDGVPTLSFTQIHTGTIFTSSGGLPVGTQLAGEIYHDASARALKQHIMCWNGTVWLTDLDLDGKAIGPRTVFVYDLTQVSDTTLETGVETLNQRRRTIRNIMSISPTQTAETVTTVFGTTPLPSNIASYQTDVSEE